MELSPLFKAVIDADKASIVICDLSHTIVYMNPAAQSNYAKHGGGALVGTSIMDCHSEESCRRIAQVVEWFGRSPENSCIFTFHNPKQNKDVYMIALRDESGKLLGYYEKHEFRNPETAVPYSALDGLCR